MLIYLLRHGDAIEQGQDDVSRPLSPLGRNQALIVANAFRARNLPLDLVLSSPLMRAKEMSEIIATERGLTECFPTEYLVPGTNERQLYRQLNECGKNAVLLVGHEPHLQAIASLLIGGVKHAHIEVRKATLICLEAAIPVQSGGAILKWMWTVEQMAGWLSG